MEYIDPKLIEEADIDIRPTRSSIKKALLIAACICTLALTTALAANIIFTPSTDKQHNAPPVSDSTDEGKEEQAPEQESVPEVIDYRVPLDHFNENFLTDFAAKQDSGEVFSQYFSTWSDMEEYIGFNMFDNSALDKAKRKSIRSNDDGGHCELVCHTVDDKLGSIRTRAEYWMDAEYIPFDIPIQYKKGTIAIHIYADVHTEHSITAEEDRYPQFWMGEGVVVAEETYITPRGYEYVMQSVKFPDRFNTPETKDITYYRSQVRVGNTYVTIIVQKENTIVGIAALKTVLAALKVS